MKQKLSAVALKAGYCLFGSDLATPLRGDRCVEYTFVVKELLKLEQSIYSRVLDIGCAGSPLTPIVEALGFEVTGIDQLPSPVKFENVRYIQDDYLLWKPDNKFNVIILCSTIEHMGLGGRFSSRDVENADVDALAKATEELSEEGILILTLPYGKESIIRPLHRVYNSDGKLLKHALGNFEVISMEFFTLDPDGSWTASSEAEASEVQPSEYRYALGLFALRKVRNENSPQMNETQSRERA